jgi:hypothetical protein
VQGTRAETEGREWHSQRKQGAEEDADGRAQVPMAGVESVFLTGTTLKMVGMDDMGDNLLTKEIAKEVRISDDDAALHYTAVHGRMDAHPVAKRVVATSHVCLCYPCPQLSVPGLTRLTSVRSVRRRLVLDRC